MSIVGACLSNTINIRLHARHVSAISREIIACKMKLLV